MTTYYPTSRSNPVVPAGINGREYRERTNLWQNLQCSINALPVWIYIITWSKSINNTHICRSWAKMDKMMKRMEKKVSSKTAERLCWPIHLLNIYIVYWHKKFLHLSQVAKKMMDPAERKRRGKEIHTKQMARHQVRPSKLRRVHHVLNMGNCKQLHIMLERWLFLFICISTFTHKFQAKVRAKEIIEKSDATDFNPDIASRFSGSGATVRTGSTAEATARVEVKIRW